MFKSKHRKWLLTVSSLFICVILLGGITVSAAERKTSSIGTDEVPYESYTYWDDFGSNDKTAVYCKPMYTVKTVITSDTLGKNEIAKLGDVCTDGNGKVYVLDSGASKVYILDSKYKLKTTIRIKKQTGKKDTLKDASGIFVKDGSIYIADTGNERVIVTDFHGTVKKELIRPDSKLIPDTFNYRPTKIVVDSKNYTYIACDGSYYGALVYSPNMEFLGFYGANTVKATAKDILQNLFNKFFSNDIKKGASVLALPYQFNDMVVGPQDFIYTATGTTGESQQKGQINVMNPGGKNILDNEDYNFADTKVGSYKRVAYVQDIAGIDVDSEGFFYALDRTYGRVFWYDRECNLLSVFGGGMGEGSQKGTFRLPNSITLSGSDVLVGDGLKNSITVFSTTEYGRKVRSAQLKTLEDEFDSAKDDWSEIIKEDSNSQLAYRGLARAYYSAGDNEKASYYSKLGSDRETYSKVFSKVRQTFFEKWFAVIFFGIIVLTGCIIYLLVLKKKRGIVLVKNNRVRVMSSIIMHPVESFREIKENNQGSIIIAIIILGLYYFAEATADTLKGFAFNYFDASSYNSLYVLLRTVGLVVLWSFANWLVCVLLGGIGKLKEIFIVTCYCLLPLVFANVVDIICSNILVPDEYVFIEIFDTICLIYTVFMLIIATMRVHDYSFGKFVGTTVLTIISMLIIVFLLFLVFLLAQQVYGWFYTLFVEIRFR